MIKTLIQAYLAPYEVYLWAGLAVVLTGLSVYFIHHERAIGEQRVLAADAKARAAAEIEVKKIAADLQAKADKAETARVVSQKTLDDYMSAHPIGPVFVCSDPRRGKPPVSAAAAIANGPTPGADPVPEVPSGSPRDVGSALDTIVRAAGAMAGFYSEAQEDYLNAQRQR